MDGRDQMKSARSSTSPMHRQSHRVRMGGLQTVPCSAMTMSAGCVPDWTRRLHQ